MKKDLFKIWGAYVGTIFISPGIISWVLNNAHQWFGLSLTSYFSLFILIPVSFFIGGGIGILSGSGVKELTK